MSSFDNREVAYPPPPSKTGSDKKDQDKNEPKVPVVSGCDGELIVDDCFSDR